MHLYIKTLIHLWYVVNVKGMSLAVQQSTGANLHPSTHHVRND